MITGTVNGQHEIVVQLPVRDAAGQEQDVEVILDTGFTGFLTLPSFLITRLGLTWHSTITSILANGSAEQFNVYSVIVIWDGLSRSVLAQEVSNDPLIGMKLLQGYTLWAEVNPGGAVQIEALP